jgi:hypothetical protein
MIKKKLSVHFPERREGRGTSEENRTNRKHIGVTKGLEATRPMCMARLHGSQRQSLDQ